MTKEPVFPLNNRLFQGEPRTPAPDRLDKLPAAPPWRRFDAARESRGREYKARPEEIDAVNAALYLRRPLLVTGKPGTGKSSLAYAVAEELGLSPVLVWPISTRSTLAEGLYRYDAIARLQDAALRRDRLMVQAMAGMRAGEPDTAAAPGSPDANDLGGDIGRYIRLGPLGTAMATSFPGNGPNGGARPRVLLIDEIDKSDVDLPNDLLNLFEEGRFEIPELSRLPEEPRYQDASVRCHDQDEVKVPRGVVQCGAFPLVILTSNGEREFPPAFLRRCLRLTVDLPDREQLLVIVREHLSPGSEWNDKIETLVTHFLNEQNAANKELATDQLLNAVYLTMKGVNLMDADKTTLRETVLRSLSGPS